MVYIPKSDCADDIRNVPHAFKMELSPAECKMYTLCEKMRDANIMTISNRASTHLFLILFASLLAHKLPHLAIVKITQGLPRALNKTGATPTASGEN
jgi:hypothetical protein